MTDGTDRSSGRRMTEERSSTERFSADILTRLRTEREVLIETRAGPDAPEHRTIIWVVVDEVDRVLIRSYRGAGARWYREAIGSGIAALIVDDASVPVRLESATDAERVTAASLELERKYAGDPATASMVRDEVLATTLELHPA